MKIFLAINTKNWGGGEKWHFETACALKNKDHNVTLLAYAGKELFRKSQDAGIRTIPVSVSHLSFLNPFCLLRLFFLFRSEKPDIVLLNSSSDIKTSGVAARLAGIRHVVFRRGSAIPVRNTLLNRLLYRYVITHIIANSEETKRTILQHNSQLFPADKISVIYNGIHFKTFDSLPDDVIYSRHENEIVIGNAGRLSPEKGQKYLIEIAGLLKKENLPFRMLIAGKGADEPGLKRAAELSGLQDSIIFPGFVKNMKAFMETIDIFVLPSLWEGFGYVTVEAMACRKPVIAFNTGANPEIIVQAQTGFLAETLNLKLMTEYIMKLAVDNDLRSSMGMAGRKRAEALFDYEKNQQEFESLLMNLVVLKNTN
jgi:glycosyltransferase involved in cell wall biosynthesis